MHTPKVVMVGSEHGDWEVLYVDGKFIEQGHHVRWKSILDALGIPHATYERTEDWFFPVPDELPNDMR